MSAEMRLLEKKRFVSLLDIARREGELLLKTDVRLFTSKIKAMSPLIVERHSCPMRQVKLSGETRSHEHDQSAVAT
ncbi:MAG: hypothetical protein RI993_2051, partial [Pseudomonadota bacterium]